MARLLPIRRIETRQMRLKVDAAGLRIGVGHIVMLAAKLRRMRRRQAERIMLRRMGIGRRRARPILMRRLGVGMVLRRIVGGIARRRVVCGAGSYGGKGSGA